MGSSAVYIAGGAAAGATPYGTSGHTAYGPPTTAYGAAAAAGFQQAGTTAYNSQAAFAQAAGAANAQAAGAFPRYAYVGTPGAKPPTTSYGRTASGVTVPMMGTGQVTPAAVPGATPTATSRVYYAQ